VVALNQIRLVIRTFRERLPEVFEDDKATTKPLDRKPGVTLERVLALVAAWVADVDLFSTLAARLARLRR
jgi:hypothetical protein